MAKQGASAVDHVAVARRFTLVFVEAPEHAYGSVSCRELLFGSRRPTDSMAVLRRSDSRPSDTIDAGPHR